MPGGLLESGEVVARIPSQSRIDLYTTPAVQLTINTAKRSPAVALRISSQPADGGHQPDLDVLTKGGGKEIPIYYTASIH